MFKNLKIGRHALRKYQNGLPLLPRVWHLQVDFAAVCPLFITVPRGYHKAGSPFTLYTPCAKKDFNFMLY